METDYAALLEQHDDPGNWEAPPGFDPDRAVARFNAFVRELEALLGERLASETEGWIQDASFHSQVFLPASIRAVPAGPSEVTPLRFSRFGDMVASGAERDLKPEALSQIRRLLEAHGYTVVPVAYLHRPYTGRNPGVTGIESWWVRYFDWI